MTSRSLGPALAPLPDGGDGEQHQQPRTDLDTRTLSLTHLSPPARWPCRWRWPLPRRAALGVDCPLVFGLGKRSWMLNIRVLCTGIRGERRQAGAAGVRPARVCRRRARLHVLTRHDHSVSRGRWGVCRLRRGPRAGGERSRRGQAARSCAPSVASRAKIFRGPHPLAHSTIVFSFSGSHEWCHSTPQHHSLLLRRPMSVCTCKSAVSSWRSCSYTRVSLSPWCARAQSYNRGSRRPRGACAHSRPLPAQPRSLPHAKCASATARKGPDEPQWRLSLRKPRRASHASQAGRRGSLCSQPSPWVQWELLRRCPCCRRPPP